MAISESAKELKRAILPGVTQINRPYRVKTSLAEDHLVFRSMRITETLSMPFEMDVEMLSSDPAINFDDVLGHNITVGANRPRGGERYFNGYVTGFGLSGVRGRMFLYRATVSPWLWLLQQTENCMIFHEMSAIDIAEAIFGAHGFADYRVEGGVSPPTYEYCVQYRESDFNLISRLFEKEGIYYYFEHENGKHTMVIVNSMDAHKTDSGYEKLPMVIDDGTMRRQREGIFSWRNRQQIRATQVTMQDYNFVSPRAEMLVSDTIPRNHAASGLELYQYPGEYKDTGAGAAYAKLRIEEQQSGFEVAQAETNAHGIRTGYRFELERHPVEKMNDDYLVTSSHIECYAGSYTSGSSDSEAEYSCTFTAMPMSGTFRPPRLAVKPRVHGPQTAVVSNRTQGEEIEPVDKHGRVTVQFEWEREGKLSCPVRVSQTWAGAGWGAMMIPRHGQEVIVEFEEGNPDRPLITGRVYNGKSEPPYDPMSKPTITTFKTNSSKGGGGFNELRFDDKKGDENVFIHAEKTMDTRVKSTRRTYIGYDDHLIVENDQFLQIKQNKHERIEAESRLEVADDFSTSIGGSEHHAVGGDIAAEAGGHVHYKAGRKAVIEAGQGLTIKCGGNFITLDPSGVSIKGTMVKINSGGSALSGPGEAAQPPDEPAIAKNDQAGEISPAPRGRDYNPTQTDLDSHPVAVALINAAKSGKVVCKVCDQMAKSGSK